MRIWLEHHSRTVLLLQGMCQMIIACPSNCRLQFGTFGRNFERMQLLISNWAFKAGQHLQSNVKACQVTASFNQSNLQRQVHSLIA